MCNNVSTINNGLIGVQRRKLLVVVALFFFFLNITPTIPFLSQIYLYAHLMKGDSSGKDYEKPCATDTSVKKDHNVAVIAAARRDMGVRRWGGQKSVV